MKKIMVSISLIWIPVIIEPGALSSTLNKKFRNRVMYFNACIKRKGINGNQDNIIAAKPV